MMEGAKAALLPNAVVNIEIVNTELLSHAGSRPKFLPTSLFLQG